MRIITRTMWILSLVSGRAMGIVADKPGKKKVFLFGLLLFVLVYGEFVFTHED